MEPVKVVSDGSSILVPYGVVDGIKEALNDLHKTGGTYFHLSFPVSDEGHVGDALFRIVKPGEKL
jgi:hypothetical protein